MICHVICDVFYDVICDVFYYMIRNEISVDFDLNM